MPIPTKELVTHVDEPAGSVAVLPRPSESLAPATVPPADHVTSMFERLARDPNVKVENLERMMAMQERIMAINRKAAFDAAFAKMQPRIPIIDEHGRIEVKGTLRSTFAPLEDIHEVIKPICAEFGFAMRHRTEWPADKPGTIRIVGILSHEQGHSEETCFEAQSDKSDYRTEIQSQGSTVSYGRRYTTLDLLNISTRKADNDGRNKPEPKEPISPDGFQDWWMDFIACADNGTTALERMWSDANKNQKTKAYLAFAGAAKKDQLKQIREKASRVAAS